MKKINQTLPAMLCCLIVVLINTAMADADLVLFDPDTIIDHATPQEPERLSTGIIGVWVNGELVFSEGQATGKRPGKVVKRTIR